MSPIPLPVVVTPASNLPRPTAGPDPGRLARLLAQVWMEVQCGRRPFEQLSPLVAPALRRRLFAQLPRSPILDGAPSIRITRVVVCRPRDGVVEASVLIERDARTTALAVRLERHRGVWRAVELTAPEQGLTPLSTASAMHPARPLPDAFDEVLGTYP